MLWLRFRQSGQDRPSVLKFSCCVSTLRTRDKKICASAIVYNFCLREQQNCVFCNEYLIALWRLCVIKVFSLFLIVTIHIGTQVVKLELWMKRNVKQFELVGNSSYRSQRQLNVDEGKGNLVRKIEANSSYPSSSYQGVSYASLFDLRICSREALRIVYFVVLFVATWKRNP